MTTPANMSWLDNFKANAAQATAAVTTGARAVGQTISERSKEAMKEAQAVVAANVQSTSDAAAANLRASAREDTAARATATASDVASAVDYIRIPKASAAKLRLLDKGDVAAMEAAHAEERAALIAECATARAALREALGEDAHQPDDLDRVHDEERDDARATDAPDAVRVSSRSVADVAAETDDGVARVLLHAARAQLEELVARVRELEDPTVSRVADDVASELASLRREVALLRAAAEDSDARLDATEARAETLARLRAEAEAKAAEAEAKAAEAEAARAKEAEALSAAGAKEAEALSSTKGSEDVESKAVLHVSEGGATSARDGRRDPANASSEPSPRVTLVIRVGEARERDGERLPPGDSNPSDASSSKPPSSSSSSSSIDTTCCPTGSKGICRSSSSRPSFCSTVITPRRASESGVRLTKSSSKTSSA